MGRGEPSGKPITSQKLLGRGEMKSDRFGKTQLLSVFGCGENPHRKFLSSSANSVCLVIMLLPGYGEERNLQCRETYTDLSVPSC